MKKTTILIAITLCCILVLSCSKEADAPVSLNTGKWTTIRFQVNLDREVLPFTPTKAMPTLDIGDPTAASNNNPETTPEEPDSPDPSLPEKDEYFKYLDYIVHKEGEETPLKTTRFNLESEESNGIEANVVDSLLPGRYHICFLAHSDFDAFIDDEAAQFQKVTDTFHHYSEVLEIKEGETVEKEFMLKRIVSRIEFVSTDKVDEHLANFTISVDNYPYQINLTTGIGLSSNSSYEQTDTFTEEQRGQAKHTHSFLTFIPDPGESLVVNLTAKDGEENTTRFRDNIEVNPERNRVIRYTGILYTPKVSDDQFILSIETEWNQEIIENDLGK